MQAVLRYVTSPLLLLLVLYAATGTDRAALADDEALAVKTHGQLMLDAGLAVSLPAAFPTGMSSGIGVGALFGRRFAWGVRLSEGQASESSLAWTVNRDDFRLRAVSSLQQDVGRGTLGLRLGLGPTLVYEDRVRNQGMRAGLTGADLETSSLVALPAADLEGVVLVHIAGSWLLILSGGPSMSVNDGAVHAGWTAQLGAGWQP